ncbi:MAG: YeaC family protein [Vibrio sp.]
MDKQQLINAITPDIYQRLRQAVETGKWPDGSPLTQQQRDSSMQAVMMYQAKHNVDAEHMTIDTHGEMVFKSKRELQQQFRGEDHDLVRIKMNDESK